MHRLTRVIGPAPSEQPFENFVNDRLARERDRVRHELTLYRETNLAKPTKAKASKGKGKRINVEKETGLSFEELLAKVKEMKANEAGSLPD